MLPIMRSNPFWFSVVPKNFSFLAFGRKFSSDQFFNICSDIILYDISHFYLLWFAGVGHHAFQGESTDGVTYRFQHVIKVLD